MSHATIGNNGVIELKRIPLLSPERFAGACASFLAGSLERHCASYFGFPAKGGIRLLFCGADDENGSLHIFSAIVKEKGELPSLSVKFPALEKFEREIHENYGIDFPGHPWLKPVRYPRERSDTGQVMDNYPFFSSPSEELHEVGVGPIHAGVIEPGHFRFICNGEQILHLEIMLGYQHRGVERLFLGKKKLLQRATLAESIAGDTAAGHSTAFANLWESLCGHEPPVELMFQRTLALELERIAMHTADLSAICTDIAYQLGSAVFGRLRTPVINFFQEWCGNRLAKGLIRPGTTNFPFTAELASRAMDLFDGFEPHFNEMCGRLFKSSSALARLEKTGVVSEKNARAMGLVGMAARSCNIGRDVRSSHPHDLYGTLDHVPILKHHGDVYSRAQVRREEVIQSITYLRRMMMELPVQRSSGPALPPPRPDSLCVSLVEGWRGEICHSGVTDGKGDLAFYKVKDPSFHNWLALALAVRNNEISDFPICNKSFNLSYCGHDL